METKGSDQIYQEANYEQILSQYWNNGTHQHEDPLPIVEEARNLQQSATSKADMTAKKH